MSRQASEKGFQDLMAWAAAYYERGTMSSYTGHLDLFERFSKEKYRLKTEIDVRRFLDRSF